MPTQALLLLLSLAIYGVVQALPCLSFISAPTEFALKEIAQGKISLDTFDNTLITMSSWKLTISGGLALLLFWQTAAIGWLANPIYWSSVVLFSRQQYKSAAILSVLAVVVGGVGTTLAFYYTLPAGSSSYSSLTLQYILPDF